MRPLPALRLHQQLLRPALVSGRDRLLMNEYCPHSQNFRSMTKKCIQKVFMLKMWSLIYVKMIFNDFEIICWEILELFTAKVD